MLGDGRKCKELDDIYFSTNCSDATKENICRGVHRVTGSEEFPVRVSRDEAPFSNNNIEKRRKTYRPVARQKHTRYINRLYLVEYLNVWFR